MKKLLRRLWADQRGEDLIEYVLLCAFMALATVVAFQLTAGGMKTVYEGWDAAQQDRWDLNADLTPTDGGS
jgi:Flp pilus assembly pilin Flp